MSRERDGSDDQSSGKSSRYHDHLVKLHDIPYSSNKDDIKQFLSRKSILFCRKHNSYLTEIPL